MVKVAADGADVGELPDPEDLLGSIDPETGLLDRHGLETALVQLAFDQPGPTLVVDIGITLISTGTANARANEREVGARLSALCRGDDPVARTGPGVFVLVAPGMEDPAHADALVGRIRRALYPFRAAIGAVLVRHPVELPDAHLRAARIRRRIERSGGEPTLIER